MKISYIVLLYIVYFLEWAFGKTFYQHSVPKGKSEMDLKIFHTLATNIGGIKIKVHDKADLENHKGSILEKYKDDPYLDCYYGIGNFTMDMYGGDYSKMLRSGFHDVGDMGNRELCDSIDKADYNIFQLNLTELPIEIRIGLCLPVE